MAKDYAAIAQEYAESVIRGDIPACKWVKAACQRQIDDLERYADGSDYIWNPEMVKNGVETTPVHHVCHFIEQLHHIKGNWDNPTIVLEPWQIFILAVVFGWIKPDGYRRFRTAYVEVPRKNGKSTMLAGVGLYMLCADGEQGAEVYSAARQRDQAKVIFEVARRQVQKNEALQEYFGVQAGAQAVFVEDTASTFIPLASEANSLEGKNVHAGLVDELHAHRDRAVFESLRLGAGSRQQSLVFSITTSGSDRSGICYEQRSYLTKILEGVVENDNYFGIIYTLDDDDIAHVWDDERLWRKANPNYGVSVLPFELQSRVKESKQTPSAQNDTLTKRFNIWVNSDVAWMDMWKWDACGDASLSLEDFKGEPCIIGADFASKIDIAALCLLFERNGILYPFLKYYLPDETVRASSNDQYNGWWREGRFTVTPGNIIDFDYIEDDCDKLASMFQVSEFAYDPHQATQFAGRMIHKGWNMIEVRPSVLNFSEPMKELEARVVAGTMRHAADPVLTWMVSNVVCHYDNKDNIYPRKEKPENKIDGVVALLSALNRHMQPGDAPSIYEKRGLRVI